MSDKRKVSEYLKDLERMEEHGTYPEFSQIRAKLMMFWTSALKNGIIELGDTMDEAVVKIKRALRKSVGKSD